MTAVERLLAIAGAEDGYLEKVSNSQLDGKTANAGTGNWTKYARDLDKLKVYNGPKNGYDWCDVFVDWCFVQAFSLEIGLGMTCQPKGGYGAGCTSSANYYKTHGRYHKSNPQPGDQIFFTSADGKTMAHTGIVDQVADGKVYTIEGNTSADAWMVANGGCVRRKSYSLSYNRIAGYGRPDYSLYKEEKAMEMTKAEAKKKVQEKAGLDDKTIQYLADDYRWGDELIVKLAQTME